MLEHSATNNNLDLIYLARAAGVLREENGLISFSHQSFQHYFCARYLSVAIGNGQRLDTVIPPGPGVIAVRWQSVFEFLVGLGEINVDRVMGWIVETMPEAAAVCVGRLSVNDRDSASAIIAETCEGILQAPSGGQRRFEAARALGVLNQDRRRGVGVIDGVPDIFWVDVPGTASKDDTITVSKYPVTNGQFAQFVAAGKSGYDNDFFWAAPGLEWRHRFEKSRGVRKPVPYPFGLSNCPVVDVNWHEAMAFCHWLSAHLSARVRLPTEIEWQRVAAHEYQTSDRIARPALGEHTPESRQTSIRFQHTTPVGILDLDVPNVQICDLVGNIKEWCYTAFDDATQSARDVNPDVIGQLNWRTLRGTCYADSPNSSAMKVRTMRGPFDKVRTTGFRLVKLS
jgi:hypothetical protein